MKRQSALTEFGYYSMIVLMSILWGLVVALAFTSCGSGDDAYSYYVTNTTKCEQSIVIELTPAEAEQEESEGDLVGYLENSYSIKAETEGEPVNEQAQQATITAEVCVDSDDDSISIGDGNELEGNLQSEAN